MQSTSQMQTAGGQKQKTDEILYLSFNQDQGCFSAGTQQGFRVFNTRPYRDQFQRSKPSLKFTYK